MDRRTSIVLLTMLLMILLLPDAFAKKEGLVLYLPFDGNVNDVSGNENHGILHGKEKYVGGKFNQALEFDGTTYIEIPDKENSGFDGVPGLTIEVWVKMEIHHDNGIVVKLLNAGAYWPCCYNLETWSDQLAYFDVGEDAKAYATAKYPLDKWFHLAGVFDGGKKEDRIYVDGQLGSANPRQESTVPDSNLPIYIGSVMPNQLFFQGALDDLAIYSRALSEAEIQQDMNSIVMPVESRGKLTTTWATIKGRSLP